MELLSYLEELPKNNFSLSEWVKEIFMTDGGAVFMYHLSFVVRLIPKVLFERPGVRVNFLSYFSSPSFVQKGAREPSQHRGGNESPRVMQGPHPGTNLSWIKPAKVGGRLDVWKVKLKLFCRVKALVT